MCFRDPCLRNLVVVEGCISTAKHKTQMGNKMAVIFFVVVNNLHVTVAVPLEFRNTKGLRCWGGVILLSRSNLTTLNYHG